MAGELPSLPDIDGGDVLILPVIVLSSDLGRHLFMHPMHKKVVYPKYHVNVYNGL